jgi:archaetidylinositol phosphate synthase
MKFSEYLDIYKLHEKPPSTLFHKVVSKNGAKVFSYAFIKLGITPNVISIISLLLLCIASSIISFGSSSYINLIVAIALLQFSYIFDCSDGVVARYTGQSSNFGAYLDILLDRIGGVIFSIAIGYYGLIVEGVLYPFAFLFSLTIYYFYQISSTLRPHYFPKLNGRMKELKSKESILVRLVKFVYEFIDTGIYFFIVSVSVLIGLVEPVIYFYGLIALALFSANMLYLYKNRD